MIQEPEAFRGAIAETRLRNEGTNERKNEGMRKEV